MESTQELMTRREFNRNATVVGIGLLLLPELTGCGAQTFVNDANAVAKAVLAIAAIEQATDPTLAAQLTAAANALIAATTGWTTGSTTAIINNAAIVLEAALAAIPITAAIAPLIPIAVAALDIILANTTPASTATEAIVRAKAKLVDNPYEPTAKALDLHRSLIHPTWEGAFKAKWNGEAKKHPELASAIIRD